MINIVRVATGVRLAVAIGSVLLGPARAEDWPQWGGNDPGRNMYSAASGLPGNFHPGTLQKDTGEFDLATAKNVKWVAKLGSQSFESPTVSGGKIFIGTNNENPRDPKHQGDRSILMCLDEQTGQFLWQLVIPKLAAGKVNDWEGLGLLSTPAVEGNRVYVVTTRCEVLCLTTDGLGGVGGNVGPFRDEGEYIAGPTKPAMTTGPQDADIVWRYDMMEELRVFPHNGSRTHSLIVGDLLYVGTCNGMDWTHTNVPSPRAPSFIALDKHTGKLVAEDDARLGWAILHGQWSSPSTGNIGGHQLVFYGGGDGFCHAFEAKPVIDNGEGLLKTVWKVDCNPQQYRFKFQGEFANPIRYPAAEGPSEILATPVYWKDRVYVAIGQDPEHGEGLGSLVCIDASKRGVNPRGSIIWRNNTLHRSMSTVSITPEGLLFVTDFSGVLYCLDAFSGKVHWVHDLKAHVWGSTLVADGKVYIGDEDGDLVIFAANKEKRILSKTVGPEADGPNLSGSIYSTPIVANGVLFVASGSHLFAIHDSSNGASARIPAQSNMQR